MKIGLKKRLLSTVSAFTMFLSVIASPVSVIGESIIMPVSAAEEDNPEATEQERTAVQSEEQEKEPDLSRQVIELMPDIEDEAKSITLNGMMPEGASATAVDVTVDYSDISSFSDDAAAATDEDTGASVLAAYDITINDGDSEYQPDESHPILVEIADPQITGNGSTELWHIKDNGEREQITSFTVSDGVISFYAVGFSVYAIVEGPAPAEYDLDLVKDLTELDEQRASEGFYLFYGSGKFITSNVNGSGALVETTDIAAAAVWYFESAEGGYKIYTMDSGSNKRYITQNGGNKIKLGGTGDTFVLSESTIEDAYLFKKSDADLWLQHSESAKGIRYFNDISNTVNTSISLCYSGTSSENDDLYNLDGKSYGIMNYISGPTGRALMADADDNDLMVYDTVIRTGTAHGSVYVTDKEDITLWTFHSKGGDMYTLSTEIGGETKYLEFTNSGLALVDESEATVLRFSSLDNGKIKLYSGGSALAYEKGRGFYLDSSGSSGENTLLNFLRYSPLDENNLMTYTAEKVSISDVQNEERVIIYTRIWNDEEKQYEFYAVDHDGSLVRCYERGDDIDWIASQLNTLEWVFTEYTYDDGTTTHYYELYNPYSGKYIVPHSDNGPILDDDPKGINLPGRKEQEYYSAIVSWDKFYFANAGMKVDTDEMKVVSCIKPYADTFFFARPDHLSGDLTQISTIDNDKYGITMKMIDFGGKVNNYTGCTSTQMQHEVIGSSTFDKKNPSKETAGLVSNYIGDDGYPIATITGKSLAELFGDATDVNHLFISSTYEESGYFEFDSCQNFASLIPSSNGNFTVFKELGTMDNLNRDSLKHGQFMPYNMIIPDRYASVNTENLFTNVLDPLPDYDPRLYEKLYKLENPDYYFGMEISANFFQLPDGCDEWGHDMIFEFTGDDDFWFYVDDVLVIDLGGIHSALGGNVNYATGKVTVNGVTKTIREIFRDNYISRHEGASQEEIDEYLAGYFNPGEDTFKEYTTHTMKIFYMERGAGASNLHMRFNLSSVNPNRAVLTKKVTGDANIDYNLVEYPFRIWYRDAEGVEHPLRNENGETNVFYQDSKLHVDYYPTFTPDESNYSYPDVYLIDPEKKTVLSFPPGTSAYRVVECGINPHVYDQVKINGNVTQPVDNPEDPRFCYDSEWIDLHESPNILYENHVKEGGTRSLLVTKRLYDFDETTLLDEDDDQTVFKFRLYLSSAESQELEAAYFHRYYVRDPAGYLCIWDTALQRFRPTSYTDISEVTSEEMINKIIQETSVNGSVSDIPVGYTFEIPDLPIGTKFKVVEKDTEVPLGYRFMEYERIGGSYIVKEGDDINSGTIRPNADAGMYVDNTRGIGLIAEKVWADDDFTDEHPTIFMAVFIGDSDTPVPGTVRQLAYPDQQERFFFKQLEDGCTLDDYVIREVKLTEAVVNGDVVTSYATIERIEDGGTFEIASTIYDVKYDKGEPTGHASGLINARTDTITNTPRGGIALRLFDWGDDAPPLPGGHFVLSLDGEQIGADEYVSDENGLITILYNIEPNKVYFLTETAAPAGYIGLSEPVRFKVDEEGNVTIYNDNGPGWVDEFKPDPTGKLLGYIDVHNKPFRLKAIKTDKLNDNSPIAGAHFALYRSVFSEVGGEVKDREPLTGYSDLVTGSNGIIPKIDNTLPPGRYYLTETQAPQGFAELSDDIIFNISDKGVVTVESSGGETIITTTEGDTQVYTLSIPNTPPMSKLTVLKTVTGSLGNKEKDFTFTFRVLSQEIEEGYEWSKNGELQETRIRSNDTFKLKDSDYVVINIPDRTVVYISESNLGYETTFCLGSSSEKTNEKTFAINGDSILNVINFRDTVIPTGVKSGLAAGISVTVAAGLAVISEVTLRRRRKREQE